MNFKVSAPGKIILSGEHAVVYGYKGIASSINLRCEAKIRVNDYNDKIIRLQLSNIPYEFEINESEFNMLILNTETHRNDPTSMLYQSLLNEFLNEKISKDNGDNQFLRQGLLVFLDLCMLLLIDCWCSVDICVSSEFPYGCGLGSSAAYCTVLSTSLMFIRDRDSVSSLDQVYSLAFRGEQIIHGTPSGIDTCISVFGDALLFQRCEPEPVKHSMVTPHLPVLLVDTRVYRCTQTVVRHVGRLVAASPDKFHRIFAAMESLVMRMCDTLTDTPCENSVAILSSLVVDNHALLRSLDVSHSAIEDVVALLHTRGIAAKLTGAGWGGCVFAFVEGVPPATLNDVMCVLTKAGYGVHLTHLGGRGVHVHSL